MGKGMKILISIAIVLALISGAFLLFGKKAATPAAPSVVQGSGDVKSLTPLPVTSTNNTATQTLPQTGGLQTSTPSAGSTTKTPIAKKTVQRLSPTIAQWNKCKIKALPQTTKLFWKLQIIEAIPAGGTYAKAYLNSNANQPVHIVLKPGNPTNDNIKSTLVIGKNPVLRGNCTDVATDGSVVIQVF